MIHATRAFVPLALLLVAAGCGGEESGENEAAGNEVLEGPAATAPEDAAILAQDPELANEAAADEAADMEAYGGNAAAMDNAQ